ncbi:MAG: class I SAM-dependent methyltransferase [Myxococcales bacterium]|nr:class I SAM-dependent methyltransferase [Myxococcales bacterium]
MFSKEGPTFRELLDQALSSTEKGYDMLATKFDATPFRTPDDVVAVALRDLGEVDDAIDLCCGTGAGLVALKQITRNTLVGVDFSQGMLDVAKERLGATRARLSLRKADVFDLQEKAAFDLVTCFGAFGHILEESEPRFLEIVRRLLRPGGRFVFVTAYEPPFYSRRFLLGKAFNAAMRARNALFDPPFIMYYLTFLLPRAERLLRFHGFDVALERGVFPAPYQELVRVVATRR